MLERIQAISDPSRFAILELVRERELSAGEIAGNFKDITRPAVSQHIRILKEHHLLRERREGTRRYYRVNSDGFKDIHACLEKFWRPRLQKLKAAAEQHERKKT